MTYYFVYSLSRRQFASWSIHNNNSVSGTSPYMFLHYDSAKNVRDKLNQNGADYKVHTVTLT